MNSRQAEGNACNYQPFVVDGKTVWADVNNTVAKAWVGVYRGEKRSQDCLRWEAVVVRDDAEWESALCEHEPKPLVVFRGTAQEVQKFVSEYGRGR